MPAGGARNRAGRKPDPTSARSEGKFNLMDLPNEGYTGEVPKFPFTGATKREKDLWEEVWRLPQGAAWAAEPWRQRTVAMWVRTALRAEAKDAAPGLLNQLIRFADQIGMTPAGMRENGWRVRLPEVRTEGEAEPEEAPKTARERMKLASGS